MAGRVFLTIGHQDATALRGIDNRVEFDFLDEIIGTHRPETGADLFGVPHDRGLLAHFREGFMSVAAAGREDGRVRQVDWRREIEDRVVLRWPRRGIDLIGLGNVLKWHEGPPYGFAAGDLSMAVSARLCAFPGSQLT